MSWPFTCLNSYREMASISGLNVRVNSVNVEMKQGELGMDDLSFLWKAAGATDG